VYPSVSCVRESERVRERVCVQAGSFMLVRCIKESEAMQGAWGSDESESSGPMQQDKMEERMEAEGGEEKGWDVAGRGKGSRSGGSGWDCVRYKREGVTLLKQAVALRPLDHSILG
jgi:hypothetical protein